MGCGCGGKKLPKQASPAASGASDTPKPRPVSRGPAVWNGPPAAKT